MHSKAEPELPQEVAEAIAAGHKIEAIKLLRERTGVGLKEAKDVIDSTMRDDAGMATQHRAGPRNDTGVGRLLLILLVLGAVLGGYLWAQG